MIPQTSAQSQEIKYPVTNQFSTHLKRAWNLPFEAYSSEIYKKFTLVIDILKEVKTFAEKFFASILEHQEIKYLRDFAFSILSKIAKTIQKISTVFKFILLPKVQDKVKKDVKNKNKAVKNKDPNKIFDAKLKTLSLIGKCLKIPKSIHSFLELILGKKAPNFFKEIAKPFKQFSFLFSLVSISSKKRSLDSTNVFYDDLKRVKYQEFFKQYCLITKKDPTNINNLSTKELKKKIKGLKSDLDKNALEKISVSAKRAFLKAASKVAFDPDLVKTHFKIKFKKKETNFFSQLEKIETDAEVAFAVKSISTRLSQKTTSDKGSISQKVVTLSIAFFEALKGLGFFCAPFIPIATTLSGILMIGCGIHTYQEFKNSARFKESMTKLTAK